MKTWKGLLFLTALALAGCAPAPVKVGFVASLTGKGSDLGLAAKRSLELAVRGVNAAGGVAGHQVEVVTLDSSAPDSPGRPGLEPSTRWASSPSWDQ
jgi:branched-chain amino acid transport system substrate-binding protein